MSLRKIQIQFVGKVFTDEKETLQYFLDRKIITPEEYVTYLEKFESKKIYLEDILDFSHIKDFPPIQMCNYQTDEGLFLGYEIFPQISNVEGLKKYSEDVKIAQEKWNKIFGDTTHLQSIEQVL